LGGFVLAAAAGRWAALGQGWFSREWHLAWDLAAGGLFAAGVWLAAARPGKTRKPDETSGGEVQVQAPRKEGLPPEETPLRKNESYYRSLLKNLPSQIAVIDRNYRIVDVNNDIGGGRILGAKCHQVFLGREEPCPAGNDGCRLQEVFVSGSPRACRHAYIKPDGAKGWLEALFSPLWQDGRLLHVIAAMREVTQEVALERQVVQTSKMEAVGTLAGGIAHEFNNLLMTVMMNTEYALAKGGADPKIKESLSLSLRACHRARDLVEQILTFSRKQDQELQVLSVKPVVKECVKMLRVTLPPFVEIAEHMDAEADTVLASPTQVRELVVNLCTNAAQAMQEKGGTITVSLSDEHICPPDAEEEHHLRLVVADDGPGMDPDLVDRIFEPFFTTKGPSRGPGMGLAVVHGIVEALGGTIGVKSAPGQGTVFDILLPLVQPAPAREEKQMPAGPAATGSILVVDDETILVDTLKRALTDYGCRVVGATRIDEAMAAFEQDPDAFDLVIADQVMPESSGLSLARKLKGLRPELPVVLCTGFSQEISREELASAGVRKVLKKPVVTAQLLDVVTRLLKDAKHA